MTPGGVGRALPPLLLGSAITLSGLTAGGLLLVGGTGLLQGAATVLGLQAGALAVGAWTADEGAGPNTAGVLRGWWTGSLVALALAATLTAWWQVRGLPAIPFSRGVALGVLVGLPQLLMGGAALLVAREGGRAPALLAGAAVGFLSGGLALLPRLAPAAVLGLCMALVGAAAALHGAVQGVRPDGEVS